jgi:hypothetical protein
MAVRCLYLLRFLFSFPMNCWPPQRASSLIGADLNIGMKAILGFSPWFKAERPKFAHVISVFSRWLVMGYLSQPQILSQPYAEAKSSKCPDWERHTAILGSLPNEVWSSDASASAILQPRSVSYASWESLLWAVFYLSSASSVYPRGPIQRQRSLDLDQFLSSSGSQNSSTANWGLNPFPPISSRPRCYPMSQMPLHKRHTKGW